MKSCTRISQTNCIKIPKKFKSKSDLGQERTRKRNLLRLKPASRMEIHCLCRILIIRDCSAFERQELEDHELDFLTFLTMIFTLWIFFYDDAVFFRFFLGQTETDFSWVQRLLNFCLSFNLSAETSTRFVCTQHAGKEIIPEFHNSWLCTYFRDFEKINI